MTVTSGIDAAHLRLLHAADQAKRHAYVPGSHSPVGAAYLTKSGKVYSGANMEFTRAVKDHAEFEGLNAALAHDEDVVAVATSIRPGVISSCCGNCRQALEDLDPRIQNIFRDEEGKVHVHTIGRALPNAYHRPHRDAPPPPSPRNIPTQLMEEAYIARSRCITLRTNYPQGAAVETAKGRLFRGLELEISSFPAAAARLAVGNALSHGVHPEEITRIALVGGHTPIGELPSNLTWDTMEALNNVVPHVVVEYPTHGGAVSESLQSLSQRLIVPRQKYATPAT